MLHSGTAYFPAQTREFSEMIANMEADMLKLDDEMSRLQLGDHLTNERRKLPSSLDKYRSLAAPFRLRCCPKSSSVALWITPSLRYLRRQGSALAS
jgi:hypothetical protein